MTPEQLAALHAAAFTTERPWSAAEFADLLRNPHMTLFSHSHGFALTCTVAKESELLSLAVDPDHQRCGIAAALMRDWLKSLKGRADFAFLEVASDNAPARSLYDQMGFVAAGQRVGYYARADARPADALLMRRDFTLGQ